VELGFQAVAALIQVAVATQAVEAMELLAQALVAVAQALAQVARVAIYLNLLWLL
jgi:hypothetical protein